MLSAEELLAGSELTYEIDIPPELLQPGSNANGGGNGGAHVVRVRPLTIRDLQLISRAAKESDSLIATLMVQRALIDPPMSVAQVAAMHVGLVQYLVAHVNRVSGITTTPDQMAAASADPLAKAAFLLAKSYGWTPQQVSELTLGQVLLHLQLLKEKGQ